MALNLPSTKLTQNIHSGTKETFSLLGVKSENKVRVVVVICFLVTQNQTALNSFRHFGRHVVNVLF